MSGLSTTLLAFLLMQRRGGATSHGDQDVKVVDNEARLVERLGLTDVVHELVARLLLDELNQSVESLVGEASTHDLAILGAALEERQDMVHLVVEGCPR